MIGCLDLIHGKLKVQIWEFHLWISWLRVLEDEDEETTRAKDESIKMEDLFPFVGDSLTVDKSVVRRIFFKDLDVTLLRLRIIRDKGMIRLYPQRGQNNIRFGVAFFIANMQLFAGILDSEAELLVLWKIGKVWQVLVDSVDGWRDREGVIEGHVALLLEGWHFVGEVR